MIRLPLQPHDKVVTSFPWRDKVLVITECGKVFELAIQERDGLTEVRQVP